jgi:dTDP-4-dehydrorhamnose 3,5-epimerase
MDLGIDGVGLIELSSHADARGAFMELYRKEWVPGSRDMVQGNLSQSRKGVLRGMHFHRRQADYWVVLEGAAFVGLFDLRRDSPSEGVAGSVALSRATPTGLYIPPGVAHGFAATADLTLLYLVDETFDGSDEAGIAWDDPDLGIAWPDPRPVLSDRDGSNPSLAEVLLDAPPYAG